MTGTDLATVFDEIMDSVVRILKADENLTDVKEVIRGDRARPTPYTPCLWVFGETAQADNVYTALQERWTLPVALVAVISSYEPEQAYQQATGLAARARSAVIKHRRLLGEDGNSITAVQDVRSGRFEPSAPWHKEKNLYSAVAVMNVIFRTRE